MKNINDVINHVKNLNDDSYINEIYTLLHLFYQNKDLKLFCKKIKYDCELVLIKEHLFNLILDIYYFIADDIKIGDSVRTDYGRRIIAFINKDKDHFILIDKRNTTHYVKLGYYPIDHRYDLIWHELS